MIHGLSELPQIATNIADFGSFIGSSFTLLVLLGVFPVAVGIRYAMQAGTALPIAARIILYATAIALPFAALACILGPMLVLTQPPVEARVLLGVGALLTAALVAMRAALQQWRWSDNWTLSLAGVLAVGMCALASAYGNASGQQQQ